MDYNFAIPSLLSLPVKIVSLAISAAHDMIADLLMALVLRHFELRNECGSRNRRRRLF